jgi:polar amino acid transport system substrate-binding protein
MALALTMLVGCSSGKNSAKATAQVIDIDLTEEEYAFGVDKDQPELLKSVNELIEKIMSDGRFDEICDRYFGDGTPVAVKSGNLDTGKDQLVVATNAAFEPFEYKQGDSYYGIDMEIADLIAKELNMELVIADMDFDAVCLSVGQHKADIAMAGLTVREDRKEYVDFTTSYYNASQKLIVKSGDETFKDCKTAAEIEEKLKGLKDIKVGVQNGTTGMFYVQGDEDWGFEGLGCQCVGYKNGSLAVQDLLNGNISYVIIDSAPAAAITKAINALR